MISLRAIARLVVLSLPAVVAAQDTPAPPSAPPQATEKPAAESSLPLAPGLSDYSGYIGQNTAHFTFIGAADGAIKGSYFLEPDQKPVAFEGRSIDATSFSAKTADADHPYLYLKVDKSGAKTKMAGAIYSNGGASSQAVTLEMQFANAAVSDESKRYEEPGAMDAAQMQAGAEAFLAAVKAGDAEKAASLIAFPLAYTSKGRRTLIHDAADFEKRFKAIFTRAYLARLDRVHAGAMRATPQGLELGPGEVWFNEDGKAFALNNEPVKMFAGKKFLSNAGYAGAARTGPVPATEGASNAATAPASGSTSGRRPAQRRRRRRRSPQSG